MDSSAVGTMEQNLAERTAESIVQKYSEEQIIQELYDFNLNVVSSARANYNTLRQFLSNTILKYPDPDQELKKIKAKLLSERARETSEADRKSLDSKTREFRSSTPCDDIEAEYTTEVQLDYEEHQRSAETPRTSLTPVSPHTYGNISSEIKEMMSCIEQLREEQKRQRQDMMEVLKTISSQRHSSPASSRHESDVDPLVIDRKYELYISKAYTSVRSLQKELENSNESDLDLLVEKAQVNVGKFLTFVEQCVFSQEHSLKRERQLQETKILETEFDDAHRQAKAKIRSLQREDEIRKRQSYLPSSIKVPSFHGDILDFASWISEYDQLVHFNTDVHKQGKLKALKEALKGTASSTLNNFDLIGDNYETAYALVRKRFGKPRLLIHHEVESVVKIPELKDDALSYRKCLEQMETRAMNHAVQKADVETVLVGLVVPKFTRTLRMSWERHLKAHVNDDACASMRDLLDFLQVETELLEASSTVDKTYSKQSSERIPKRYNSKRNIGSAQSLAITSKPQTKKASTSTASHSTRCSFCGEAHALKTCTQFCALDHKDRLIHVFTAHICRSCLEPFGGPKHSCGKTCSIFLPNDHQV